jgi:hypothetical protein
MISKMLLAIGISGIVAPKISHNYAKKKITKSEIYLNISVKILFQRAPHGGEELSGHRFSSTQRVVARGSESPLSPATCAA